MQKALNKKAAPHGCGKFLGINFPYDFRQCGTINTKADVTPERNIDDVFNSKNLSFVIYTA